MLTVRCRILFYSSNGLLKAVGSESTHRVLQDGDYLYHPEVIQTLHPRISEFKRPSAVHLLPPYERLFLSNDLQAVYSTNLEGGLHTSFSWIRHGMVHRSLASEILPLIQISNFSNGRWQIIIFLSNSWRPDLIKGSNWVVGRLSWWVKATKGTGSTLSVSATFLWYRIIITSSQLRAGYYLDTLLGGDSSVCHMCVIDRDLPFASLHKGEEWSSA